MLSKNLPALGIPLLFLSCVGLSSLFVVTEVQQALVLQFGELVRTIQKPGLNVKLPFIQDVVYYDKRILDFDVSATAVTLGDQKRIVVDTFTRYRIADPALFYKTVQTEIGAQGRLAALVTGSLRSFLGSTSLQAILSPQRKQLLKVILDDVSKGAINLGIEVVDVRIRRADLPPANSQAIFNRMISDRQKEASKFRAEGEELARKLRAEADLECTTLMANAEITAQQEMSRADQKALEMLRTSYQKNPEFAAFYQSKNAYEQSIGNKNENTTYYLTQDHPFLKYLNRRKAG